MISIKSYLRYSDRNFVPIEESTSPLPDDDYVEGAIELSINGVQILDFDLWDDVDVLWSYMVNMMVELNDKTEAQTYFPDQPIPFVFEKVDNDEIFVLVQPSTEERAALIGRTEFVAAMREAGTQFFTKMVEFNTENKETYQEYLRLLTGPLCGEPA